MTTILGIDPGLDGAVAWLWPPQTVKLFDTPTLAVGGGRKTKREFDIPGMIAILRQLDANMICAIESVHSMPKQGVASSFAFGKGFGIWLGILSALEIPYSLITPQRWKGALLDGMGKEKDAARLRALQLFPKAAHELARKKDVGRADALLLAEYLRRTSGSLKASER